jgi:hypothetical protein
MINGTHVMVYSHDAEADRAFLRDTAGFAGIDAGEGWLIFKLPQPRLRCTPPKERRNTSSI